MPPSRSRPSAAVESNHSLPAYEPPFLPLSIESSKTLNVLANATPSVHAHLSSVLEVLASAAYDLGERTTTEMPASRAKAARQEVLDQLEKAARDIIDAQAALNESRTVLKNIANVEEQEVKQVSAARRTRARQGQADDSDDEDEGEDRGDDLEKQVEVEKGLWGRYKTETQKRVEQYQAQSMREKYTQTTEYLDFRRTLWEGQHGETPMPHVRTWFANEGDNDADAAGESSDEDFEIAEERQSFKCPLTLRPFQDPVTSTMCPHSFEKDAIYEMIRKAKGTVQCPMPGCNKELTMRTLKIDKGLLRKMKRQQQRKERAMDMDEQNGQQDNDDEEEEEQPRKGENEVEVKKEKFRNRRGRAQVLDLDDEDDDE